jgi:4-amino-4-deoxy-L-arabinose transferase-like glycosyltransferase
MTAEPRAIRRGKKPNFFKLIHATAYSNHSFMLSLFAPEFTDLRQYAFSRFSPATSNFVRVQRCPRPVKKTQACQGNQAADSGVLNSDTVEPNPSATKPENVSMAAKISWTVLIIATLYVCYFSHLGAIGFVGPDEPRYAWIAREMVESGDWVTPRLYGKPWFEKPVLYYWGAAASFKLFGVSEAAARLPSAISALLATLALAWLALRLYGAETARWLLLLLPTTVGMIGFSHAASTDMPFSAMLTIALVCAAVVLRLVPAAPHSDSSGVGAGLAPPAAAISRPFLDDWPALILFGFFLGLAVLAKGPAAIILSGGAVFFWALFTKRWRDAVRLFHPAALATFCATALPWYILCARRNPDFFRIFIIEHNFKRYLTPEFQHIQPFWFYVPVLLLALLPWSAISVIHLISVRRTWSSGNSLNSLNLFLACWTVFPIVFFSLSKSKLPGYILPTIPPFGLLIAQGVSLRVRKIRPGDRWTRIACGLTLITLGLLALPQLERTPLVWPALVLALGGFLTLLFKNLRHALAINVAALIVAIASTLTGNTREVLDQRLSARAAPEAARIVWNNYSPERSSTYKLTRSFQYELNFYFHRELPEWSQERRTPGWVFTSAQEEFGLRSRGLDCPFNALRQAVIVCRVPELADSIPRSGQLQ